MKKYTNIIFDLDGTLLDSEQRNAQGLLSILQKKAGQTHLSLQDIIEKMGKSGILILQEFNIAKADIDEYLNDWVEAVYQESQKPTELFDGVEFVLKELQKKNISCGIVSSKTRDVFNIDNSYLNFKEYFTYIVLADDTNFHKPHPDPLLEYLTQSNYNAQECIYIGDTYADLICAKESNMDFGLATWGASSLFEQEKHILRFTHPQDILDIIQ